MNSAAVDPGMVVGWKAICQALGGVSKPTALKWARDHGLPVHRPAGAPVMLLADRDEWVRAGRGPRRGLNRIRRRLRVRTAG